LKLAESLRRIFPVKRTNILAAVLVALSLITTGCGTSDYVQSVQLTTIGASSTNATSSTTGASTGGFFNLVGADGTLQLEALAIYHSGKTIPVTNSVTWNVTEVGVDGNTGNLLPAYGPTTVPINSTGLMTAIEALCTWIDLPVSKPSTPAEWAYTGYYQVKATYKGMLSQPIAIGVGSEVSGNSPAGGCGPS
jgi:hypothetical protein